MGSNQIQWGQLFKIVADILGLALLASTTYFFTKIKQWWVDRQARKFDLSINKSAKTQSLISELRALTDSDSIKVFQLHNGTYFLNGGESMKASMTNYYVKTGIAMPSLMENQNIPTTHLSLLFKGMRDHGRCEIFNLDNPDEVDPMIRRLMSNSGIHTGLVVPLRRAKDIWVGFVTIGWLDENVPLTPVIAAHAMNYADQICDQLCCPVKK